MGHDALAPEQRRTLATLSGLLGDGRFYLAGGSAIAVHLGHRLSEDLDFFSRAEGTDLDGVRRRIVQTAPGSRVLTQSDVSLRVLVGRVRVDFVDYPYPPLEEPVATGTSSVPVAGLRDLAAMKLAAVAKRGIRRDFWDIHEMAHRALALREMLAAYRLKFGVAEPDVYHVLRALTYFADAERDPIWPAGLSAPLWKEIAHWFVLEVPSLLRSRDP